MTYRGWIFSLGLMLPLALPLANSAQAQIFGPSDEAKAHEAQQDQRLGQHDDRLTQDQARIQQLEDKAQNLTQSLSRATGANEELSHQLQQLNDKLDRQEKDFSYRLCMLSAQQLGAGNDQGLNCAASGSGAAMPQANAGPGNLRPGASLPPIGSDSQTIDASGPRPLLRPPGTLGSLPSSRPSNLTPSQPGNSGQFDAAMNLLGKAQFAEASAAFRAYADANPDDSDLSPQAIYWIGDIAYVRQDYPTAVTAFAEQIKKYPTSNRSPDSMLKLGQSLLAEGQTNAGCTTLGALKTRYPQATASTLAAAAGARKASCNK